MDLKGHFSASRDSKVTSRWGGVDLKGWVELFSISGMSFRHKASWAEGLRFRVLWFRFWVFRVGGGKSEGGPILRGSRSPDLATYRCCASRVHHK